ncbi:PPE family protein [Candidatus Mycobacterium wuenschmannii]|uniref:PPE family protein n=1 Tax=Candidatus Mycobacterium wuenschmannii TaxID=3027808 RepID=A0ABY8W2H1_9MYCO|nr:PPE family protein [Candidatus Mycobacterium wuenschmannii]WIM89927.1 PPE family protein [Candidatus Mycobacterium wuenschmannii]
MSSPVWMASPPEVHSALLSSGPGAGPTLAAASAWQSLSAEYLEAADEIDQLLAGIAAGVWEGAAAESYVAAHAPYVAWLSHAAADSAARAAQLDVTAAAYDVALGAMPTLGELAANHVVHGTLVATNFFGINTIPITVNEADYLRMWVQAAATMTGYQAASAAAVAATPPTAPAPAIVKSAASQPPQFNNPLQPLLDQLAPWLKSLGIEDGVTAHDPMISNELTTFVSQILQNFGVNWDPGAGILNGHVYDFYADASQPIWYLARSLELFEDFLNISQNPGQALQAFQYIAALALFDWPTHIAQLASTVSQSPALLAVAAGAIVAPVGAAGGLAGLAGLAVPVHAAPPAFVAAPTAPGVWPASTTGTAFGSPGTAPSSAPAPASTAGTVAGSPPPPTPPSAGATGFVAPYAVGPPGIGFGSGLGIGAAASDKRRAPEPDATATAAAARSATPTKRRARRRQREALREYGNEFMDATDEAPADRVESSTHGSGPLGFAGTVATHTSDAAGLSTLAGDAFGDDPVVPMLPTSWGAG